DGYTTNEDTPLSVPAPGVLDNDTDPDAGDTLTAVLVSGPGHAASFALNADGSFSYTPAANYNGSDSFTYKAKDSKSVQSAAAATVALTITPVNDAPVAGGQSVSTDEDTAKSIILSATDADGDTLSFSIVSGPSHGSLGSIGTPSCAGNACT